MRFDLREANNLIETLQEELHFVKSELDLIKSKPLDDGAKGNSLFSEVYDKYVHNTI